MKPDKNVFTMTLNRSEVELIQNSLFEFESGVQDGIDAELEFDPEIALEMINESKALSQKIYEITGVSGPADD